MLKRVLRKPVTWAFIGVVGAATAFGLYWFQPWRLVTNATVNEALPDVVAAPTGSASAPSTGQNATASPSGAAGGAQILVAGSFITHEHETTGTAQIVRLPDGRRQLLLRELATSNGPDLRVWLTDQPVIAGVPGWRVFDDGRWVELAKLKGNLGDQAYDIPDSVDLSGLSSVSIWCKRFAVSFGAAELLPAGPR